MSAYSDMMGRTRVLPPNVSRGTSRRLRADLADSKGFARVWAVLVSLYGAPLYALAESPLGPLALVCGVVGAFQVPYVGTVLGWLASGVALMALENLVADEQ